MNRGRLRRARVLALQALYQLDSGRDREDVSSFLAEPQDPTGDLARSLTHCVWQARTELDDVLQRHLHDWSVARLGLVERAVLRLALYELLHQPEVPVAVVINEAVALAKRFASKEAGGLVNAVLDHAKALRNEPPETG